MPYQIRLAVEGDVPPILEIYGPLVESTVISFEYEVPSTHDMWRRIEHILRDAPWLVCTSGTQIAGYAYAASHRSRTAYRWSRELSVYVRSEFRGKSVATALYRSLISLLQRQGYTSTFIGITLPNDASVKFHEKMGYQPVGIYQDVGFKNGAFHDVGWWQMKISNAMPGEIRRLNELDDHEWEEALKKGTAILAENGE